MQYVTPEYKESMRQPLRDRGYMRVTFGGVNDHAQSNAQIAGNQLSYSDPSRVFNNGNDDYVYATLEENFTRVGDLQSEMYFQTDNLLSYKEKGFISDDLIPGDYTFTISFGNAVVTFGTMIFNFGDNYPAAFTITDNNGNSYDFTNEDRICQIDQLFENVTDLTITITEMLNENSRFRLYSVRFDNGFEYQNDMILDSNLQSSISPICENLPQMDFHVKLVNENHYFDTDNPRSILNQFDTNTEVNVFYGYQLIDRIEWLQAAKLFVESWNSDRESATIYTNDILQAKDKDYTGANYYSYSLYNLATAILTEMGITDYSIDADLANISTKNALVNVTCKQALQIIANAGCKKLFIKRDGSIRIGDDIYSAYTFSSNGEWTYSNLAGIGSNGSKDSYASLEGNFTKINNDSIYFQTDNPYSYKNIGYVSAQMSNFYCRFQRSGDPLMSEQVLFGNIVNLPYMLMEPETAQGNPILTITLSEKEFLGGVKIIFGETYATRFILRSFMDDEITEEVVIYNSGKEIDAEFDNGYGNKIEIEFVETAEPYNRIHVNYIEVLRSNGFNFDEIDIMSYPVFTKFDTVQKIIVSYYSYTQSSGEWKTTEYTVSETLNDQGKVIEWKNPLVTSSTMAQNLLTWLKEYYQMDGYYEFDTRGNPEVDANDQAVQKKYNGEDMNVLITDISLGFNGAFSGSVKTLKIGGAA